MFGQYWPAIVTGICSTNGTDLTKIDCIKLNVEYDNLTHGIVDLLQTEPLTPPVDFGNEDNLVSIII